MFTKRKPKSTSVSRLSGILEGTNQHAATSLMKLKATRRSDLRSKKLYYKSASGIAVLAKREGNKYGSDSITVPKINDGDFYVRVERERRDNRENG